MANRFGFGKRNKMKDKGRFKTIYSTAVIELSKSDKYLIRLILRKYDNLYKQQRAGKLKHGEYALRRKNYLNLIDDILGFYSKSILS
jgi:hypothetical protein